MGFMEREDEERKRKGLWGEDARRKEERKGGRGLRGVGRRTPSVEVFGLRDWQGERA